MPVQHKYRPHHLALAVALALGCAEFSLAQELSVGTTAPPMETADQLAMALAAFANDPDTHKFTIKTKEEGIDPTFSDGNDLVTVSGRGSLTGLVDGGEGSNYLQLDTASGGTLGESRRFQVLETKRSTWTLKGSGDFSDGVWVRPKATLINDGHIAGNAWAQGTLVNNGRIDRNVSVESGGTLTNPGTIEGDVFVREKGFFAGNGQVRTLDINGKLSVDSLHGAPKVRGDLKLSKTAELAYEVNASHKSETIVVGGTASLGGATLNIVSATNDYLHVNENTILTANKVEGEFGKVLNNLAFLSPTLDYKGKQVDLAFIRNDVPFESAAISKNGKEAALSITEEPKVIPNEQVPSDSSSSIAASLNPAAATDTSAPGSATTPTTETPSTAATLPPVDTPVTASNPPTASNPVATAKNPSTPTNAAVAALLSANKFTASLALEQLSGGGNANLAKATINSDSPVSATLLSAMRQMDSAAVFGSQKNAPHLASNDADNGRVWLQALGHRGTLDRYYDPLKHSTEGLVLGADWSIDEEWRLGVMGGKSETRLDSRGIDGQLDSWHLGAYAMRQNGPMSLRLGATFSSHDGNTKRRIAFNGFSDRPEGRYDANTQQAFAEFGYNLGRANVSIEPFASLGYQRYQRDSYTEKGGAAALKVLGQTRNNINSTFGLRLAKLSTLDNGMQLTPRFSAGWKHTYGDIYSDTRQRLATGGENFTVYGAPLDRDSLMLDAGLDLGLSAKHTLGVGLNGDIGTDSRSHGVMGQWRMTF